MTTIFTHDCDRCVHLGRSTTQHGAIIELYYCPNPDHPALSSLIARFGDEPWEYESWHPPEAFAPGARLPKWTETLISRAREADVYIEPKRS